MISHVISLSVLWPDEGPIMNDTMCRLDHNGLKK